LLAEELTCREENRRIRSPDDGAPLRDFPQRPRRLRLFLPAISVDKTALWAIARARSSTAMQVVHFLGPRAPGESQPVLGILAYRRQRPAQRIFTSAQARFLVRRPGPKADTRWPPSRRRSGSSADARCSIRRRESVNLPVFPAGRQSVRPAVQRRYEKGAMIGLRTAASGREWGRGLAIRRRYWPLLDRLLPPREVVVQIGRPSSYRLRAHADLVPEKCSLAHGHRNPPAAARQKSVSWRCPEWEAPITHQADRRPRQVGKNVRGPPNWGDSAAR